jgi:DNA-directed RNA polymerase alpha subunit
VLLQQVSDYAVQQLLAQMQERMEHLENTLAAMVAAADCPQPEAPVIGDPVGRLAPAKCESVSMETPTAVSRSEETDATPLAPLLGNTRLAAVLARAGFGTVSSLAAASDEQLLKIDGVSEKALKQIRERVPA